MGCRQVAGAIVCSPSTLTLRRVRWCPVCKRRRRFVGLWAVWYPTIWTCLGCGHDFDGDSGERMPAPWAPKWWEDSKRRARKMWDQAPGRDRERELAAAMVAPYVGDET